MIIVPSLRAGWEFENTPDEIRGMTINSVGSGIGYANGKVGRAATFTSTNTGISVGDASSFNFMHQTGVFTVAGWFKLNDYTAIRYNAFASNFNTASANTGFMFGYDNRRLNFPNVERTRNTLKLEVGKGVANAFVSRISIIDAILNNNWNFFVFKSDGITNKCLINNINQTLFDNDINTPGTGNAQATAKIGNRATNDDLNLDGQLSNLRFFDKALSDSDCERLYHGLHPLNG